MKVAGFVLMAGAIGAASLFDATNREAATRKAAAAFERGEYQSAVTALKDVRSDDSIARFNRGTAAIAAGDKAGGARDLSKLGPSDPLAAKAAYNLGTSALEADDYAAAVRQLENSLRLDPRSMAAKRNLELAIRKKQEQEKSSPKPQKSPGSPESKPGAKPADGGRPSGRAPMNDIERLLSAVQQQEKEELRRMQKRTTRPVAIGW